jgi:hypothetical protein
MKKYLITGLAVGFLVVGAYKTGKLKADAYYQTEPEIKNCPGTDSCSWREFDDTTLQCIQNCKIVPAEIPVTWIGDKPSCSPGFDLVADEDEALAGKDSAHCVQDVVNELLLRAVPVQ